MSSRAVISIPRVNRVSGIVVNAAMRVHSVLGPGLLESAYQVCLEQELRKRGLMVEAQLGLPVVYEGQKTGLGISNRSAGGEPSDSRNQMRGSNSSRPRSPASVVLTLKRKERRAANQFLCRPPERRHQSAW
jgi:hypothetical protein